MKRLDMSKLHVLIVDDEKFARQMVIRMLNEIGVVNTTQAENGDDGLEKVEMYGRHLDAIICDLEMPRGDGFTFVMKLRKIPDPIVSKLPVIILTGNTEEENVRMALRLGIRGFMAKPLNKGILEKRLNQALMTAMVEEYNAIAKGRLPGTYDEEEQAAVDQA